MKIELCFITSVYDEYELLPQCGVLGPKENWYFMVKDKNEMVHTVNIWHPLRIRYDGHEYEPSANRADSDILRQKLIMDISIENLE